MTVVEEFANFVTGLRLRSIPEGALSGARRSVVDWYGATIAGGVLAPATLLTTALASPGNAGRARLWPQGTLTDPRTAALINGSAAHTVEVDDIYRDGLYHPGAPVIAAALALAEDRDATGMQLLRAVVAGYEVSNRIAEAVNPAHYRYWHTTATVGFFGAAAACSSLAALDSAKTAHALATAGTFAAGLQQAFRSDAMSKPLHAGRAAEGGLVAALGAEAGITGAPDILEGAAGFAAAMSGPVDWASATSDLGTRFTIEAMSQKAHACCGHTFAAVDAALELRLAHDLGPDDIESIDIRTYGTALEICGNTAPRTAFEAKFSLPYCVAAAITVGHVAPSVFDARTLKDLGLRHLMTRIDLGQDPELDAAFPRRRAATVVIATRDGRSLERHRPTRKGDPDDPLSDGELAAKFRALAEPVLGARNARSLLDALWQIDDFQSLASLPLGVASPRVAHG